MAQPWVATWHPVVSLKVWDSTGFEPMTFGHGVVTWQGSGLPTNPWLVLNHYVQI
jgi:hypothetical protein